MNTTGTELEGTYAREISTDDLEDRYRPDPALGPSADVAVEYTVENDEFEFGDVSAEQIELLADVRLLNSGEQPQPGVPDGAVIDITSYSPESGSASPGVFTNIA
jgi:hypothetical protein